MIDVPTQPNPGWSASSWRRELLRRAAGVESLAVDPNLRGEDKRKSLRERDVWLRAWAENMKHAEAYVGQGRPGRSKVEEAKSKKAVTATGGSNPLRGATGGSIPLRGAKGTAQGVIDWAEDAPHR